MPVAAQVLFDESFEYTTRVSHVWHVAVTVALDPTPAVNGLQGAGRSSLVDSSSEGARVRLHAFGNPENREGRKGVLRGLVCVCDLTRAHPTYGMRLCELAHPCETPSVVACRTFRYTGRASTWRAETHSDRMRAVTRGSALVAHEATTESASWSASAARAAAAVIGCGERGTMTRGSRRDGGVASNAG